MKVVSEQELDQKLQKFDLMFGEIIYIKDKLSCISFDISRIKLNSTEIISNFRTIKEDFEKLNRIEGLNKLSIEKLTSNQTEQLIDLNRSILEFFNEVKTLIDNLPKNDDTQQFYKKLDEFKQLKSDILLQRLSSITSLIGFALQLYLQYRPV